MKTLIAYFSYMGHTRGIAQQIQEQIGGTLFEIQPATAYSSDYDTTEAQGRKETRECYHPPLTGQVADLDTYDAILLGTPNWFNTIAPPVATFLSESNMDGKKVAVFCTNGGGGLGHIPADVAALCKGAEVLDSLNIYEDGGTGAKAKITSWLKRNHLANES